MELEDVLVVLTATTGTVPTLFGAPLITHSRRVRFVTAGTFIGLTKRGVSRTLTGVIGEVFDVSFISKTGGTADVELYI